MRIETAENWYEVRTLDDGVTHIEEPHIVPFYRCNIWLVQGRERDLLVDSGSGIVSLREQVAELAERRVLAVATHSTSTISARISSDPRGRRSAAEQTGWENDRTDGRDKEVRFGRSGEADRQLAREPLPLPRVRLLGERRSLLDYRHHPGTPAPVSA